VTQSIFVPQFCGKCVIIGERGRGNVGGGGGDQGPRPFSSQTLQLSN
jgi:hypothetical protein